MNEDLAQAIKTKLLLSSVVKDAVELKGGGGKFLGLCPFHQEKTPSFHVRDKEGRFKCFGCGAAGDVFAFIMRLRGLGFKEAKAELALRANLSPLTSPLKANKLDSAKEIIHANNLAHKFFIENLRHDQKSQKYLREQRKLSPAMIQQAALGFGGSSTKLFINFLKAHNITRSQALSAGLLKETAFELVAPFEGRIIFPIRSYDGKLIAFGGRSFLEEHKDAPKYINTQAHSLYEKRTSFYGLYESKQAVLKGQNPYLVEGYFDAMALWACGVPALALCGTALSSEHVSIIKRLSSRVIICFDNDAAGHKAVRSALGLLFKQNISASLVKLADKDPGDYLAHERLEELKNNINDHQDAFCAVIDHMAVDSMHVASRMAIIDELLPIFSHIARPLLRRQYVAYLANKLHEDPALLWAEIKKPAKNDRPPKIEPQNSDSKILAEILASYPDLANNLPDSLSLIASPDLSSLGALELTMPDFSLAEAQAMIEALALKFERKAKRALLQKQRQKLQEAEKAKDFASVYASLREQSEFLGHAKAKPIQPIAVPPKPVEVRGEISDEEDWW